MWKPWLQVWHRSRQLPATHSSYLPKFMDLDQRFDLYSNFVQRRHQPIFSLHLLAMETYTGSNGITFKYRILLQDWPTPTQLVSGVWVNLMSPTKSRLVCVEVFSVCFSFNNYSSFQDADLLMRISCHEYFFPPARLFSPFSEKGFLLAFPIHSHRLSKTNSFSLLLYQPIHSHCSCINRFIHFLTFFMWLTGICREKGWNSSHPDGDH